MIMTNVINSFQRHLIASNYYKQCRRHALLDGSDGWKKYLTIFRNRSAWPQFSSSVSSCRHKNLIENTDVVKVAHIYNNIGTIW